MYTNPAAQAMYTTGVDNLRKGVDANTKRMAGAAVVAALLPGLMSCLLYTSPSPRDS